MVSILDLSFVKQEHRRYVRPHNNRRPSLQRQKAFRIPKAADSGGNRRRSPLLADLISSVTMESDESDTVLSSALDDESWLFDDTLDASCCHAQRGEGMPSSSRSSSSSSPLKVKTQVQSIDSVYRTNPRRSVTFSTVTVHYHDTILGDSPAVSLGAPIALGWKRMSHETLPVSFETQRPRSTSLRLGVSTRHGILRSAGVSVADIQRRTEICDALRCELQQSVLDAHAEASSISFRVEQKGTKRKFFKRLWRRMFGRRTI